MAIGERIRFFRNKNGMTQKHLGKMVGFPEKSAESSLWLKVWLQSIRSISETQKH